MIFWRNVYPTNIQQNGSKLQELDSLYQEASKELARIKAQVDLKLRSIQDEKDNLLKLKQSKDEAEKALETAKKSHEKMEKDFEDQKVAHQEKSERAKKQEELLQSLTTGMSGSDGQDSGYASRLDGTFGII